MTIKVDLTNEEIQILRLAMRDLINRTTDTKNLLYTSQGIENINNTLKTYEEIYEKFESIAQVEFGKSINMFYSFDLADLIKRIPPFVVVKYLKSTGWIPYKRENESIKVFQKITDKDEFYQVIIPIDKTLADYNKAMFEAVKQIALLEGKTAGQIILHLLIVNIKLTSKEIQILQLSIKNLINRTADVKNLLYTTLGIENVNNILKKYKEVDEKLETAALSEY